MLFDHPHHAGVGEGYGNVSVFRQQVYPRVCGGTGFVGGGQRLVTGLSPRVRGNPSPPGLRPAGRRSIPACAREPLRGHWRRNDGTVYPRVCGGTDLTPGVREKGGGLSPRVRGNPPGSRLFSRRRRSIPACAGEPLTTYEETTGGMVYPRVCGGTGLAYAITMAVKGLSPRVRGNRLPRSFLPVLHRSIPACAGEPEHWRRLPRKLRVYPRVCGGTILRPGVIRRFNGLSPRVRGNLITPERKAARRRSIPACAGEPRSDDRQAAVRWVYPRVCGGTGNDVSYPGFGKGLSPRVRGNRTICMSGDMPVGSIPACAGEPVFVGYD